MHRATRVLVWVRDERRETRDSSDKSVRVCDQENMRRRYTSRAYDKGNGSRNHRRVVQLLPFSIHVTQVLPPT